MSFETTSNIIRAKMNDNWDTTAFPVAWDNDEGFTHSNKPWVRFNIKHNTGEQVSLGSVGNRRFRRNGIIFASCFIKSGGGNKEALAMADDIIGIFQGVNENGVFYYDCSVREVGNDKFGWYQINVLISFQYDIIS